MNTNTVNETPQRYVRIEDIVEQEFPKTITVYGETLVKLVITMQEHQGLLNYAPIQNSLSQEKVNGTLVYTVKMTK